MGGWVGGTFESYSPPSFVLTSLLSLSSFSQQVALKAHNGHYLSINSHGQIHMTKERTHESHFVFVKEELDHAGCVAIKEPVHGAFLT